MTGDGEVCAEVGASTQALYTLFGGMPGLVEAAVGEGFVGLAGHVDAVPETEDPVADHLVEAGRLRPAEAPAVARQFLSATHGYLRLEIGGAFGEPGSGLPTAAELAVNLLVGLGDTREAAERSMLAAAVAHQALVGP